MVLSEKCDWHNFILRSSVLNSTKRVFKHVALYTEVQAGTKEMRSFICPAVSECNRSAGTPPLSVLPPPVCQLKDACQQLPKTAVYRYSRSDSSSQLLKGPPVFLEGRQVRALDSGMTNLAWTLQQSLQHKRKRHRQMLQSSSDIQQDMSRWSPTTQLKVILDDIIAPC